VPPVYDSRILPKVLLLRTWTPRIKIVLRHTKGFEIRGKGIAVRPITAEKYPILSKEVPQLVKLRFVEACIEVHLTTSSTHDF
jgi:hypothetical protein